MKVNIFATSEFEEELLNNTYKFLKTNSKLIEYRNYGVLKDKDFGNSFNNTDAFSYCRKVRITKKLNKEDYIICITSVRHEKNWFSYFNGKNIFISTFGTDILFDEMKPELYLVSEIVTNIIESKMEISLPDDKNKFIHMSPEGCINDFCGTRNEIKLKMRAGFICQNCFKRAKEKFADDLALMELLSYTSKVRKEIIAFNRFDITQLPKLHIQYGEIRLNNLKGAELIKGYRLVAFYIFLLNNPEGLTFDEIWNKKEELVRIYFNLKHDQNKGFSQTEAHKTINSFFSANNKYNNENELQEIFLSGNHGYLSEWKNKINKSLKKKLGNIIADYFMIHLLTQKNKKIYKIQYRHNDPIPY